MWSVSRLHTGSHICENQMMMNGGRFEKFLGSFCQLSPPLLGQGSTVPSLLQSLKPSPVVISCTEKQWRNVRFHSFPDPSGFALWGCVSGFLVSLPCAAFPASCTAPVQDGEKGAQAWATGRVADLLSALLPSSCKSEEPAALRCWPSPQTSRHHSVGQGGTFFCLSAPLTGNMDS